MSGGKHGMGSLLQDEQDLDNDMFDIFSSPQGDVHMEKGKTQEILSEISISDESPVEFRIASQASEYLMMPVIMMEGDIQIFRENGDAIDNTDDFTVTPLLCNTMFKQIECQING